MNWISNFWLFFVGILFIILDNISIILDNSEVPQCNSNASLTLKCKSTNRLSLLSSESEKNSSDSVDVISSSTECTSPESDLLSLSTSSSGFGMC